MQIQLLCSDKKHAVYPALQRWLEKWSDTHDITLHSKSSTLTGGELLFLISASEIVTLEVLGLFNVSLVVHGSDLPKGRGWSPVSWQLIEGKVDLTLFLIEADIPVDSGRIWKKIDLRIEETYLFEEISNVVSAGTLELMDFAVMNFSKVEPQVQVGEPTFYPKRSPNDSEIYPGQTVEEVFNLLRTCDPQRYPAFFTHKGRKFKLIIEGFDD